MIDEEALLKTLEEYEKEYIERENEYPCKYYAGRADAYREMWKLIIDLVCC